MIIEIIARISGAILLGAAAVIALPREEEPQIIVPMIDIFVQMPGAGAREVEQRITKPMEKLLWEIPGVEYIYSTSSPGMALAVAALPGAVAAQDEEVVVMTYFSKELGEGTLKELLADFEAGRLHDLDHLRKRLLVFQLDDGRVVALTGLR